MEIKKIRTKSCICLCGTELDYTHADVRKLSSMACGEISDEGYGIQCPTCKEWVETDAQGLLLCDYNVLNKE